MPPDRKLAAALQVIKSGANSTEGTCQLLHMLSDDFDDPRAAKALRDAALEIGGEEGARGAGHPELDDAEAVARIGDAISRGVSRADAISNEARRLQRLEGVLVESIAHRLSRKLRKVEKSRTQSVFVSGKT
jgi:hypothetical protein